LLGHVKLEHTVIYLQLSQRHLQAVANPLDAMAIAGPDVARRSRRLHKRRHERARGRAPGVVAPCASSND
jgi:hypothetical protein